MLWARVRRPSQAFIISGLGFETAEWLVASLLNDAAVKVWTLEPQLDSRAMPYKPWLGPLLTQNIPLIWLFFMWDYLALPVWFARNMSPIIFKNKVANARAGAHTLPIIEFIVRNFVVNVCLGVASLATCAANSFFLWLWNHDFIVFEFQYPNLCGNVHVGLMHYFYLYMCL